MRKSWPSAGSRSITRRSTDGWNAMPVSLHQASGETNARLQELYLSRFNNRRHRDHEHDPQRSVQAQAASVSAVLPASCLKRGSQWRLVPIGTLCDRTGGAGEPTSWERCLGPASSSGKADRFESARLQDRAPPCGRNLADPVFMTGCRAA